MSTRDGGFFRSESVKVALWIDQLADEFEAAWLSGQSPKLLDSLADLTGEARSALLEELVRIDQVYRSRLGPQPSRDDYRAEFPELPAQAPSEGDASHASWRSTSLGDSTGNDRPDRSPSATAPATVMPGIRGFELLCELGRGNMGVVYKARQTALDRTVALKMMLAGSFAGPEQLGRFRLEALAVARLRHPNIVQIYEVGEYGGLPYCVLEYVDGRSLANTIDGCPQPPRQAAEFVEILALAVHEAHQQGIIHRDLKPANILLSADGRPKIADFGLAKHLNADGGYTQSGVAIGTPSYMSVEQAEGRSSDVGPASDVYALGAIVYEMLTGRPPFRGATLLETLEQVRSSELVPPKRLQPNLSRDLETICLKAMARDPSRRYATAEALAHDLRRWLDGRPILARPAGLLDKIAKWGRRRPAIAALVVLAIAAAVVGVGGMWWHTVQLQQALDQTDQARHQSDMLRATSEQHRERAESMVYATDMQLASASYLQGDMFEVSRRLDRHVPTPALPDRREFTWRMLWALRHPNELVFHGHQQDAYVVRVVAGGRQLVTAGRDGTLRLWDIADPTHSEILGQFGSEMNFVAVAPDGIGMATGSDDGTVRLWNLATRAQTGHFVAHANWVLCGAISPQGDRLATAGRDNTVRLWTLAGELTAELKGHTSTIESLVFLPDGQSLASTGTDGTVRLWDVASKTGSVLGTLNRPAYCVACSHDGRLLALASEDHAIYLWDVQSRKLRARLTGHAEWVQCVEFSRDDTRLASAGKDGSVRIWDVARQASVESFAGNSSRAWSVAWLPDGTGLVSSAGDGTVRLWHRSVSDVFRPLEEMPSEVVQVFPLANDRCIYKSMTINSLYMRFPDEPTRLIGGPSGNLRNCQSWCAARSADRLAVLWSEEVPSDGPVEPDEVTFYNLRGVRLSESLKLTTGAGIVALAPDGARLVVAHRSGRIEVYELPSLRLRWARVARTPRIGRLQFTLQGSEIIALSGDLDDVDAYSAADGRRRTVVDTNSEMRPVVGLAVSPDGRRLATGGQDGSLRVWDFLSQNVELARQQCNDGQINALAFSPDGRTLVTGTVTGTVTLWHTATWQPLARFNTLLGKVLDLCFSPQGDTLAVAGATPTGKGQVLLLETDHPKK